MNIFLRKTICLLLSALFFTGGAVPVSAADTAEAENKFIKWVDFDVSYIALSQALERDVKSHGTDRPLDWIELLAYLAAKYGGKFSKYKQKDLDSLIKSLDGGKTVAELAEGLTYYPYYLEAYTAVLGGFVGEYSAQAPDPDDPERLVWQAHYGLKVFSPVAAGYYFSHYDDFGSGRSYGYSRRHLGHDLFGEVGTPIVAVEGGVVEVMGWNRYGGWRLGVRSHDGLRYYYYAHLRKNRPYHCDMAEGVTVRAGDVIGYMGRTGYSTKENTNNIKQTHLHFGLQLIFDPSQKDGPGEIWVDLYAITRLLDKNRSAVYKAEETKEYYRRYGMAEG